MDALLNFLKNHPDASEGDIANAVSSTVDVDISAERYRSDPKEVTSAFLNPVRVGKYPFYGESIYPNCCS